MRFIKRTFLQSRTWEKNAIESKAFLSKSMYIMDSNQYDIELVTYLLVLVVYFYELIVYMLLERNAFDSIVFFSQWILKKGFYSKNSCTSWNLRFFLSWQVRFIRNRFNYLLIKKTGNFINK